MFRCIYSCVCICVAIGLVGQGTPRADAAELVKAPSDYVFFKLSNVRVENAIGGKIISFDYKRTRDGMGEAHLAARTDEGTLRVDTMFLRLEDSGTIRLTDRFSRLREIINRGQGGTGIEFYFVVGDKYNFLDGKQFLVSNSVRHGSMNTRLSARSLSKEEQQEAERRIKATRPPESVPKGHTRCTGSTPLVAGTPVLVGIGGEWKQGVVVSLPSSATAKVMWENNPRLLTISRDQWLAISKDTERKLRKDPGAFTSNVRTLDDGNLVLADDVEPLGDPTSLVKGTPVVIEKYSNWTDAFFVSADNISAQIQYSRSGRPRLELIPLKKIAIRKQTLVDLQDDKRRESFASNIVSIAGPSASFPTGSGSMNSAGSVGTIPPATPRTPATEPVPAPTYERRQWSDATGKFNVDAQLVRQESSNVLLRRADGSVIQVPVSKLSGKDQEYLKGLTEEDANPFANVVSPSASMKLSTGGGSSAATPAYRKPLQPVTTVTGLNWGAKSVAISSDNRFLLIGRAAASASLCELETGRMLIDSGRMDHMGDIHTCGFSPDGKHAVLAGYKGVVEVYEISAQWQMKTVAQFAAHTRPINCIAFSADGKCALTGGDDKEAKYWEVATGKLLSSISGFAGKVKATCITPSGKQLLATDGQTLKVFQLDEQRVVREVQIGKSWASGQAAAFSPNGLLLVAGDSYDFRLWNLETFSEMPTIKGESIAWSITFTPDSQHFLSGHNGVVNIWDAKTQTRVLSQPVGSSFYVKAVATNPQGNLVTCPSDHRSVVVMKTAD